MVCPLKFCEMTGPFAIHNAACLPHWESQIHPDISAQSLHQFFACLVLKPGFFLSTAPLDWKMGTRTFCVSRAQERVPLVLSTRRGILNPERVLFAIFLFQQLFHLHVYKDSPLYQEHKISWFNHSQQMSTTLLTHSILPPPW